MDARRSIWERTTQASYRKAVKCVTDAPLHITDLQNDGVFSLQLPLLCKVNDSIVELQGRFPLGAGRPVKCHAKYNMQTLCVRVDSFDDPAAWFEARIVEA